MQALRDSDRDRVRRVLVIDDNEATHQDFRKVLARRRNVLDDMESVLFGEARPVEEQDAFEVDSATQGEEGVELVQHKVDEGRPYDLAFVDMRMPPGLDGLETIARIWEVDPQLQIVLCAAYLGYTQDEVVAKLGRSEGLAILGKPFEPGVMLELAHAMTASCHLLRQAQLSPA